MPLGKHACVKKCKHACKISGQIYACPCGVSACVQGPWGAGTPRNHARATRVRLHVRGACMHACMWGGCVAKGSPEVCDACVHGAAVFSQAGGHAATHAHNFSHFTHAMWFVSRATACVSKCMHDGIVECMCAEICGDLVLPACRRQKCM